MNKIGFIDYYLDEWHANNYPEFFRKESNGEFQVTCAYGKIDSPLKNGLTNKQWSENYNIPVYDSAQKVIDECDYIIVLSPDNPEMHEELSKLPLESGKRTYIDKTFASDRGMAERIFEYGEKHGTPCYSSSALFFADEYANIKKDGIETIDCMGPGTYEMYSIHQIEPIVKLMGIGAKRIMSVGSKQFPSMVIEYTDGRTARFSNFPAASPFVMNLGYKDGNTNFVKVESEFFNNCIKGMIDFFKTGEIPVQHENTLEVISIREAGVHALDNPFTWIEIK